MTLMLVIVAIVWFRVDASAARFIRWLLTFLLVDSVLLFITSAVLSDGLLFILNREWEAASSHV